MKSSAVLRPCCPDLAADHSHEQLNDGVHFTPPFGGELRKGAESRNAATISAAYVFVKAPSVSRSLDKNTSYGR